MVRQVKKEEEGIVISLDGKIAKVQAKKHSDCEACGACSGDMATIMDVYNPLNARVGQRVIIKIPEDKMLKSAFIVFLLPMITTFMGYLIGVWISQKYGLPAMSSKVGASVVAFVLTLLYIRYYDRSMAKAKTMPFITDILSEK